MDSYNKNQRLRDDVREAYMADDFFTPDESDLVSSLQLSYEPTILPHWMGVSRLICFMIGSLGFIYTLLSMDYLSHVIPHPFFLNLALLTGLGGFFSYMIYPYMLSTFVTNGGISLRLLKYLNGIMLGFSVLLGLSLLTIPIAGLGLCLILLPVPISFAWSSKKYLRPDQRQGGMNISLVNLFNQDLIRLAWMSLFAALILFFAIIFFGF